jgi:hypothetical protein
VLIKTSRYLLEIQQNECLSPRSPFDKSIVIYLQQNKIGRGLHHAASQA